MMFKKSYFLLLVAILCLSELHSQQINVVYANCTEDTYVQSGSTAPNHTASLIYSDITSTYTRRMYLKFDIAGLNLPANAIIVGASIRLRINSEASDVDATSYVVQRANSGWSESSIVYALQPTLETADATNFSSKSGSYRFCDATAQVQTLFRNPSLNNGFCIRRANETTTTGSTSYYTINYTASDRKPVLEIQYYVPYKVSAATIVHASNGSNGSISPVITGGPGGTTYQWYNSSGIITGANSVNLTNATPGWYGLKMTGSVGTPGYMAFIIGSRCQEVNINFNPGPDYIDDAMVYDLNSATSMMNLGNYALLLAANWTNGSWYRARTLLRFNLWMDAALEVSQADLNLFGTGHNPLSRPNTSELLKITQPWEEMQVTHNTMPASTNSIMTLVPATSSSTENKTLDIKNFWNDWKLNNTLNYGMLFQLQLYNNTYTQQSYHSSDATNSSLRPNIQFKVTFGNDCICNPTYAKLEKTLRGVNYPTCTNQLYFYYEEEYTASTTLKYSIRNAMNQEVLSSTTIPLTKEYGDNRYELAVSSLFPGTYILEVTNEKNERFYLRFSK